MEINDKYRRLEEKLGSALSKESTVRFLEAFFIIAACLGALLTLATLIEWIAEGNRLFRTLLFFFTAAAFAGSFATILYISRSRRPKGTERIYDAARRVGNAYSGLDDRLANALQLFNAKTPGISDNLRFAELDLIYSSASALDFDIIVERERLKRNMLLFLGSLILFFTPMISSPGGFGAAFERVVNFSQSYIPPAPFSFKIEKSKISALRGEALSIKITGKGKLPENIDIMIKEEGQDEFEPFSLRLKGNTYEYEIPNVRSSFEFYGRAVWISEEVQTSLGKVEVSDKPMIQSFAGRISYPSYTGLQGRSFTDQNADIAALTGTNVRLDIGVNKEVDSAFIILELNPSAAQDTAVKVATPANIKQIPMKIAGRNISGGFAIMQNGSYHIEIKDKSGLTNEKPIRYSLVALTDENPSISMLMPSKDVKLDESAVLPISVEIGDDYGFKKMELNYRLTTSRYAAPEKNFTKINIPVARQMLIQEVPYFWSLAAINISPEDEYEFFVEVFDNDVVRGPKSARTSTLKVKLPSLDEVLKDFDNASKNIEKEVQEVMKQAEEIKKNVDDLQKDLRKNFQDKEMNWEQKKKAEDIARKQEQLQQKVDEVQKKIEENTQKMQENKVFSSETMKKFEQLQKMLSEVNSPELRKYQEKLNKSLQQMSPKEMQAALEKMKMDEEQFRQNIERTMKILNKMKAEQKTDAISKMAEELSKQQEKLQKSTENADLKNPEKAGELAKQQDRIEKDFENMDKEMQDLKELMENSKNPPMEKFEEARQSMEKKETEEMMREAEESIKQGEKQQAKDKQNSAKNNMKKFSESMKQLKKEMNKKMTEETKRQMQKSVKDLIELSEKQESLNERTKSMDYSSTQVPEMNKKQGQLQEALENVAQKMVEMSENSFAVTPQMAKEISNAMQQMNQAQKELSERKMQQAKQQQSGAMSSMNKAAQLMQQSLNKMQGQGEGQGEGEGEGEGEGSGQGGSGGGQGGMSMGQQLQQAAALQQMINNTLQQMKGERGEKPGGEQSGQGGQGGSGQGDEQQKGEMGRLSSQQGKALKSVEELAAEQKKFAGGDKKAAEELNDIAKDMREVVSEMQSGNYDEETLKKQDKILSRLLDATRSVNERDFEKKREAQSAKEYFQKNPSEFNSASSDARKKALQDMLNSLKDKYSKDYELLIKSYFDNLKNIGN